MRKGVRPVALAVALAAAGCAPKIAPAPVVLPPQFPDYLTPTVPPALEGSPAAESEEHGWQLFQAGNLKDAEREFTAALRLSPSFYPAQTALGYLDLGRKDPRTALTEFERALAVQGDYAPALVGRGQTLEALGREADALGAFTQALAANPTLPGVQRRVEVLQFRVAEADLTNARQDARGGRLDEAAALYRRAIARSPDSAFLYRELGGVERQHGDNPQALEDFRKAVALDATDAASFQQIGELLDAANDYSGAAAAYTSALAIEPTPALEAKLAAVRTRAELARLPAEYRAIDQAPAVTRADLAALIGVRLGGLLTARRREGVVLTDIRTSWAASWIMAVADAGVMEPFANHTFQPRAPVHRIDLAQTVSRLLDRVEPGRAKGWQTARLAFPDLASAHLAYPAASIAVASGVLATSADGSFQPSKTVSGREAVDAIERLRRLAGPAADVRSGGSE